MYWQLSRSLRSVQGKTQGGRQYLPAALPGEKRVMNDRDRLRTLSQEAALIADAAADRKQLWENHNRLQPGRPLVLVYPESAWPQLIPFESLRCRDPLARQIEWRLLLRIYHHHHFNDDMPFDTTFHVPKSIRYKSTTGDWFQTTLFHFHTGLCAPVSHSEMNPVSGFIPLPDRGGTEPRAWASTELLSSPADTAKLVMPEVEYLEKDSLDRWEQTCDYIGEYLQVKLSGMLHISFHLASIYVDLRGGMMHMLYDFYDRPELLHATMAFLTEACKALLTQYEQQGLYSPNSGNLYHSSGGLTSGGDPEATFPTGTTASQTGATGIRYPDLWASAEAQEFSEVSPDMYGQYILPYEKQLLAPFGHNGYGCCEPLEGKLAQVLTLPNLRRLSCSPSSDVARFAKAIGDRYILSWKPDPALLSGDFVPSRIRRYLQEGLQAAQGCVQEIILKDLMVLPDGPVRIQQWLEILNSLFGRGGQ